MKEVKSLDRAAYTIDPKILKRFDATKNAFGYGAWQAGSLAFDCPGLGEDAGSSRPAHRCQAERALAKAASQVERHLVSRFCGIDQQRDSRPSPADQPAPAGPAEFGDQPDPDGPAEFGDPETNTDNVKTAARKIGADLVGVCKVAHRWVYSHDRRGEPVELPDGCDWAVVMGIRMDPADIMDSTGPGAHMATMIGYMRMGLYASALALFIRQLGFRAVAACNEIALSIPLAIDAGFGELGRHGLLVTPQFGPCVRICKVFTDMPLAADKPITFGVEEFCRSCRRCAEACQVDAISKADQPSFDTACACNNPGIERWAVHVLKCFEYWGRIGGSCSACIAACPFTMIGWHRSAMGAG